MAILHNLGFPRIGASRELKFALESYWQGQTGSDDLLATAAKLRERHWQLQSGLDWQPVGDFSLYDQMLDISVTLGNLPARALGGKDLDSYFRAARGRAPHDSDCQCKHAAEMTKWFDTNYHYLVPELTGDQRFTLADTKPLDHFLEAKALGYHTRPVLLGPVTFLKLAKAVTPDVNPLALLDRLVPVYADLLARLRSSERSA